MSKSSSGRPLPAYIYRRRRLAVFGGLFVVLALIGLLLSRPWASGSAPSGSSATMPPVTDQAIGSADAPACASGQVKVTAYTDAESYAAGVFPQLTVGVQNTGSAPCTLNVGTAKQVFTISTEGDVPWISSDCQSDSADYPLVLQPGALVKSEPVQWDRTRSNPGTCTLPTREAVPAGGAVYQLTASVDGIPSTQSAQFTLN